MPDPLTMLAIGSALASLGLGVFGPKGGYRQTRGPSDEDIRREQEALRAGRTSAAMRGARAGMQAAGGVLARTGGARGGAVGTVAGNIGAQLGEQLGRVEGDVGALGARLRGLREFEYEPSWAEQGSVITGQLASSLGSAAALRSAITPEQATGPLRLGQTGRSPPFVAAGRAMAPGVLAQGLTGGEGGAGAEGLAPLAPLGLRTEGSLMAAERGGGARARRAVLDDLLDLGFPGEEFEERVFERM